MPSSTRCTCAASPTPTATASATSPGLRARLPYLRDLGVDAVWIAPWYPSPMADGGYDVADYRDIDPLFGTLADADALLADAHDLGLRVIIDLVANHTSEQHPWFRAALAAAPGSPERERYFFRDGRGPHGELPPNDWISAFGGPAWTRSSSRRPPASGTCTCSPREQPDLDWSTRGPRRVRRRSCGSGSTAASTASASTPSRPWPRSTDCPTPATRRRVVRVAHLGRQPALGRRRSCTTSCGGGGAIADAYDRRPAVRRRGGRQRPRTAAPLRASRRTAHRRSTSTTSRAPVGRRRAARGAIDASLAALAPGRRAGDVGAVQPRRDPPRHPVRPRGDRRRARGVAARRPPRRPRARPRRARAAALLTLALPGGAYVYQGEELGLPEVEDLPDEVLQDPTWDRSGPDRPGPRRVPGAAAVDGRPRRPSGSRADDVPPWLPQPPTWAA